MNSFLKSFFCAVNGFKLAIKQRNLKIMFFISVLTVIIGFVFDVDFRDWCVILLCIGVVVSLELINTTIEHLVNFVEPNFNEKAGAIKDISAAAVLFFSLIAVVCGILIFGSYIADLF